MIPINEIHLKHPCYSSGKPSLCGRLHLPVSPTCNIRCGYCNRALNSSERRPGVAAGILPVSNVLARIEKALSILPELSVVGVAGPGDPLASEHALEALTLVRREFPELMLCMSTNGLRLPDYADRIFKVGISAVTVTVNAVDPAILSKIVLFHDHYKMIINQFEGIRRIAGFAVVKVNTVLIPGINDKHVVEVAKMAADAGASIQNIIPLIPQYKLSHFPAPTPEQMEEARKDCERYIPQYRNCARCRADACGVPGKLELSDKLGFAGTSDTFSHG